MQKVKRIAILTTGGDCAGLNATIRAITIYASHILGWEVLGLLGGGSSLRKADPVAKLLEYNIGIDNIINDGGTILGSTNKSSTFPTNAQQFELYIQATIAGYNKLNLDAIIAIGGDGSMKIYQKLIESGAMNIVGIPKTIDNDLDETDQALGFSSAVEVVVEALDRLKSTAASHERLMIVEVMGRDAGHIALASGIAGGADIILIPEINYNLNSLCEHLRKIYSSQRPYALMVVSEAVKDTSGSSVLKGKDIHHHPIYGGIADLLATKINSQMPELDIRTVVLGHTQRGAAPNAADRILAAQFGVKAVNLVKDEDFGKVVVMQGNQINAVPMAQLIDKYRHVKLDDNLIQTAHALGIFTGA